MSMKGLKELHLKDCEIGDRGIASVCANLDTFNISLEQLDLSGNLIGQSPYFNQSAAAFMSLWEKQSSCVSL